MPSTTIETLAGAPAPGRLIVADSGESLGPLAALLPGKFVVFEGPDGSGKSTQFSHLAQLCRDAGIEVCEVREPGGTEISERIRDVLLDHHKSEMALRCEMLLYMASRAQLVEEKIRPALARGAVVLADRFVSSTYAYQGTAGGIPKSDIDAVAKVVCGDTWPNLVLIFDVDSATAAKRMGRDLDRMESKGAAFHANVRQGYLDQATAEPGSHLVIDARGDEAGVFAAMMASLRDWAARQPSN
ncbi:MAG: dTMP kinase [Planctomycetota bacterium]|nr:dTMP kinase [Planctomycetota bacterium]